MLKVILKIIILFTLGFSGQPVHGQLTGNYTIGNSGADFLTVKEAIDDLDAVGISGPVIFNIQPGSYFTSVYISPITGSSPTNTVTFKSQNNDSTSVELVGPNCFTFDRNVSNVIITHLTLKVSWGAKQGRAIRINQNTSNIDINNCVFTEASGMTASDFDNLSSTQKMTRTYILLIGTTDLSLHNNVFGSNGAITYKIGTYTINDIDISGNLIEGYLGYGFILNNTNNIVFNGNFFSGNVDKCLHVTNYSGSFDLNSNQFNPSQLECAYIHAVKSPTNNSIVATNNFFPSYAGCLRLFNINEMKLNNNSFNSENSRCLTIGLNDPNLASFDLQNNVFSRSNLIEPCVSMPFDLQLDSIISNNNAFGNDTMAFGLRSFQTTLYNLDDWVVHSSKDQSSIIVGHVFSDFTDLHTPNAFLLDGSATPLPTVTTDIDLEARSNSIPDIGADEFTMDFATYLDLELIEIIDPNVSCSSSDTLFLKLTNNCLTQIDSFKVAISFDGTTQSIFNSYVTIIPGETVTVPVPECLFRDNTLYQNFHCSVISPNGLLDNNRINNHGELTNVFRLGNFKILDDGNNYSDCLDKVLTVPELPFSAVSWSTSESTWSINVNSSGTYSATVTFSNGCQSSESITIN